jgi:phenylalanyl-tRNA synthetase beta chain
MMRVPVSWLKEYVPFDEPVEDIAARLVISSCEVDRIVKRGVPDANGNLQHYLVGKVVEAGKHPNADRLQLCRVDVGDREPRQIVCGAWNFGAGATVAVALPGAVLPGGQKLEQAKLRGEVSNGMILSERELELGVDQSGILVLEEGPEPGTPLADVLPLTDDVLELETGHNRPDLLSVYGIAREVAALLGAELAPPPGTDPPRSEDEPVAVQVEDFDGCPRYIGRTFLDVRVAPSPPWLKARLLAAGMRPISNVVDITNYVMLGLGNPLHAFDQAKLAERRIVVRRARKEEQMRTLDDTLRELDERDLVIADAEHAVAIAGIMGSLESEVDEHTTDVLLEAANFEPLTIHRSSERMRLRTEGSNRWEKGVDPYLAEQAAKLATELLVELAGARWTGDVDVRRELPERPIVHLRPERTDFLVGLRTAPDDQRAILERLGFDVSADWNVTVPTWRARDVTREADVIEEVARFRLDDVPFTLPQRTFMFGRLSKEQRLRRAVEEVLVGCGFSEAYNWSLVPQDDDPNALRLPEPLSAEQAVLRTTLRRGLVESAQRNVDAGADDVALFEIARVYLPSREKLPEERWRVGGMASGGFARAKGAVEALHEALKVELRIEAAQQPFLHPGKAARLDAGWVGELHPSLLEGSWGIFELDLATLFAAVPDVVHYEDVITYPPVRQDLAFVVDEDVPAGMLVEAAREAAGDELREMRPFDVYRGEQVGPGRKSIAFAVTFQSNEKTLTDEEAGELRNRIVTALQGRFGAQLRARASFRDLSGQAPVPH